MLPDVLVFFFGGGGRGLVVSGVVMSAACGLDSQKSKTFEIGMTNMFVISEKRFEQHLATKKQNMSSTPALHPSPAPRRFAPLDPSSTQPPPLPPLLTCECRKCISKFKSGHRIPLVKLKFEVVFQHWPGKNHVSEILGRVFCLVTSENTSLRNQSRFQISNTDGRGSSLFFGVRNHQQITSHIFWASRFVQRCPGDVGVASGFVWAVRRVESPLATPRSCGFWSSSAFFHHFGFGCPCSGP